MDLTDHLIALGQAIKLHSSGGRGEATEKMEGGGGREGDSGALERTSNNHVRVPLEEGPGEGYLANGGSAAAAVCSSVVICPRRRRQLACILATQKGREA